MTTWTNRDAEKGFYTIELINNGIGPALIEEFSIIVDGKVISGQGVEPIEKGLKIIFPNLEYTSFMVMSQKGYSMAAKEKVTIVAIRFLKQPFPSLNLWSNAYNRVSLK